MKTFCLTLFCICFFVNAQAQKLPNTQQAGLKAPTDVKTDAKTQEWGDKFEAYNATTEIFYTIANDGDNLYIVANIPGADNINRFVGGGLSFVIPRSAQKNEKDKLVFTFPGYDTPDNKTEQRFNVRLPPSWDAEAATKSDNKTLKNISKFVRTSGVNGVDSIFSIYNIYDIKAACEFNINRTLNLEMAIPLKYLKGYISAGKFSYRIIINGVKTRYARTMVVVFADGHQATEEEVNKAMANQHDREGRLGAPTEFSAEYTLTK